MLSKAFGCRVIHNGRVASNDISLGDGERLTSNQPWPADPNRPRENSQNDVWVGASHSPRQPVMGKSEATTSTSLRQDVLIQKAVADSVPPDFSPAKQTNVPDFDRPSYDALHHHEDRHRPCCPRRCR